MLTAGYPLLTIGVVLVAGVLSGQAAKRLGLPGMTGQLLFGILLSPTVLGLVSMEALHDMRPLTEFALGLIAVAVGNHLNLKRLRNSWLRLTLLILFEVTITPLLVFGAAWLGGNEDWTLGLMLAAMAVATAPATVVAIVAEARARGVFVKTLVAAVALNNLACIVLFEVARAIATEARLGWHGSAFELVLSPLGSLGEPMVIGFVAGGALIFATRRVARSDTLASASMIAILLTAGVSDWFHVSPLLSCLFLGVALANITPDKDEIGHQVFEVFENAIFAIFFTLAGMELDFAYLAPAGVLAVLFVTARALGKMISASAAMTLAGGVQSQRRYLGLALIPQAGVAVGLVLLVQSDEVLSDISQLFLAIGITAVAISELIGPLTTRYAVVTSGEAGRDRPRVIDFLHEEHILTDLGAVTYEQAIGRLTDHLMQTHNVELDRDAFVRQVLDRETHADSRLGHGLAIPHARIEVGGPIVGVMGISREGLQSRTPDGEPLHCVVLLATPEGREDHHLEVLAAFARAISADRNIEHELYEARSPAHAYEVLHAGDAEDFNYFLEDLMGEPSLAPPPRPSEPA